MDNKTYDTLKWAAIVFFPALSVLVKTIGSGLDWVYTDTAVLVINATALFLGSLLGVSARTYSALADSKEEDDEK
ncbi:phage holin [Enterococcus italicus]|uniref:phage holin n=1 Tax=Enterococcus italicus TaxID=246144 RepID=UPI003F44715F